MSNQNAYEWRESPDSEVSPEEAQRRQALSDPYGRFYAPIAVVMLALAFMPLLEDVVVKDETSTTTYRYGTLLDMVGRGGEAGLGLMLLGTFVGLLAVAAVRVKNAPLPASIAVVAVLMLLMLIGKPGTGDPTPELTGSGVAGGVLAFVTIVIASAHAAQIRFGR